MARRYRVLPSTILANDLPEFHFDLNFYLAMAQEDNRDLDMIGNKEARERAGIVAAGNRASGV